MEPVQALLIELVKSYIVLFGLLSAVPVIKANSDAVTAIKGLDIDFKEFGLYALFDCFVPFLNGEGKHFCNNTHQNDVCSLVGSAFVCNFNSVELDRLAGVFNPFKAILGIL